MSVHSIMIADESGAELVKFARQTAIRLVKDNLTRSQIRNIFTEVRQIEALWGINKQDALRRLNMLKPKLAYQTARHRQVGHLETVLSEAITEVDKVSKGTDDELDEAFNRFIHLFEAILAYHRAEGGRN